jgi:hypothetical protein
MLANWQLTICNRQKMHGTPNCRTPLPIAHCLLPIEKYLRHHTSCTATAIGFNGG